MAEGGGWISKYGIPGVLASVAVFAFQQQGQVFDRLQQSLQAGYQFYSSARTQLQYSDDADRELSLLKIVGNAFPNIYCDVREDIFERASAAEAAAPVDAGTSGRTPIDSTDLSQLREQVVAADRPARRQYPENLGQAWLTGFGAGPGHVCPAVNQPDTTPQHPMVAENKPVAADAAPPPMAMPAPATEGAPAGASAESRSADNGPVAARMRARGLPGLSAAAPSANAPNLQPAPELMRVFFHIPQGGNRDPSLAENARADLAGYNFRVVRGVERVPSFRFPDHPEIRYYGPDEAAAAQQLKVYLDWAYRNEHLTFTTRAIGSDFQAMPRGNIEVWIPNQTQ